MRPIFVLLLLLTPLSMSAQESSSGPLFMKHLLGDREFFEPWGVGFDFFTMDQDYGLKNLQFNLPGAGIEDPSKIKVTNELQHLDLQLSVWLTPFLNVFGIVGRIDSETLVDFRDESITGTTITLGTLPISYDGTVYGGALNLIYRGHWGFVSLNNNGNKATLEGVFDSSISSYITAIRKGLITNRWDEWG